MNKGIMVFIVILVFTLLIEPTAEVESLLVESANHYGEIFRSPISGKEYKIKAFSEKLDISDFLA